MNRMSSPHSTASFFTPEAYATHDDLILAKTYNLAHTLLHRSEQNHLFVPILSMQYLAIIEASTFWFVDSMAYAVQDGEGGRIITISWKPQIEAHDREGLDQHMACHVTYYGDDQSEIQNRLRGEFLQAMELIDERYREKLPVDQGVRILPFRPVTDHSA